MQATPKAGLAATSGSTGGHVQVLCRFRPVNLEEEEASVQGGPIDWLEWKPDQNVVCIRNIGMDLDFNFDRVFAPSSQQAEIFNSVGHVVNGVMEGFNGSILAYGQTSSGKTHTMQGYGESGVMPRALESIFASIARGASPDLQVTVRLTFVEIYCERIIDLLGPASARKEGLKIYENAIEGTAVQDAAQVTVSSIEDVHKVLKEGAKNRATSATKMNSGSSRSHAMLQVLVTQVQKDTLTTRRSKLMLVDLAGSERLAKTGVRAGARMEEAKNINRSLTSLGIVIRALAERAAHVPFRDSKLTRLLQQSLGGNSRTSLIICCASELKHAPETVSTLRFGERARLIATKASKNETLGVKELKLMLAKANAEIEELKAKLAVGGGVLVATTSELHTTSGLGLSSSSTEAALADTDSLEGTGSFHGDATLDSLPPLPPPPLPSAATEQVEMVRKLTGLSMMVRNFAPLALDAPATGDSPRPTLPLDDEASLPTPTPRGSTDLDVSLHDDEREELMLTMARTLALSGRSVHFDTLADSGAYSGDEISPSPSSTRGRAGWEEVGLDDDDSLGPIGIGSGSAAKFKALAAGEEGEGEGRGRVQATDEEDRQEEERQMQVVPPPSRPALSQSQPLSRSSLQIHIEVSGPNDDGPTPTTTTLATPLRSTTTTRTPTASASGSATPRATVLRTAGSPSAAKPLPPSPSGSRIFPTHASASPSGSKPGTPRGLSMAPMWASATLPSSPRRDSKPQMAATWQAGKAQQKPAPEDAGTQSKPQAGKGGSTKIGSQPGFVKEAVAQEQGHEEDSQKATQVKAVGLSSTGEKEQAIHTITTAQQAAPSSADQQALQATQALDLGQRVVTFEQTGGRTTEQQGTQTPTQVTLQSGTQTAAQVAVQNGTQTANHSTTQNATQTIAQAMAQSATQTITLEPPAPCTTTTSMQATQTSSAELGASLATATQTEAGQQAIQGQEEEGQAQEEQPTTPPTSSEPQDEDEDEGGLKHGEAVQQAGTQMQAPQDDDAEAPIDVTLKGGVRGGHMASPTAVAKLDRATSMGPLLRAESDGDGVSLVNRLEVSRLSREEQVAALEAEVKRLQAQLAETQERAEEASRSDSVRQEEMGALRKELAVTKDALKQRQQQQQPPQPAHADARLKPWVVTCLLGCAPCILEARDT